MGRGRAKAKQTKVARDLKYSSGGFDLDRLRADLGAGESLPETDVVEADEDDEELDDPYAALVDEDEDEDQAATR